MPVGDTHRAVHWRNQWQPGILPGGFKSYRIGTRSVDVKSADDSVRSAELASIEEGLAGVIENQGVVDAGGVGLALDYHIVDLVDESGYVEIELFELY